MKSLKWEQTFKSGGTVRNLKLISTETCSTLCQMFHHSKTVKEKQFPFEQTKKSKQRKATSVLNANSDLASARLNCTASTQTLLAPRLCSHCSARLLEFSMLTHEIAADQSQRERCNEDSNSAFYVVLNHAARAI